MPLTAQNYDEGRAVIYVSGAERAELLANCTACHAGYRFDVASTGK